MDAWRDGPEHASEFARSGRPLQMPPEPPWDDPLAPALALMLAIPALPGHLREARAGAHPLHTTLEFGSIHTVGSPFASVATRPYGRLPPSAGVALLDAAARLFGTRLAAIQDPAASVDPAAAGPVKHPARHGQSQMRIDGVEVACIFLPHGGVWTALAYLPADAIPSAPGWPGALVTVAARSIPFPDINLVHVTDLEPFRSPAKDHLTSTLMPPPPPAPLNEIEELILAAVRESPIAGRGPVEARNWIIGLQARWLAANQTLVRFGRQPAASAARTLLELLDQMKTLASAVSWWQEAGPDAVAESTRHAVFGSDVASLQAQRLWVATHADPAVRTQWLDAWERWYRLRRRRAR